VPLAIVNLLMTAFLLQVVKMAGLVPADPYNFVQNIPQTLILLLGNVVIIAAIAVWLRNRGRRERDILHANMAVEGPAAHAIGD
jgi:hypothetical protein